VAKEQIIRVEIVATIVVMVETVVVELAQELEENKLEQRQQF
jgi:hypothetical protein